MFSNLGPVRGNTPKSLKHLTHPKTSGVSVGMRVPSGKPGTFISEEETTSSICSPMSGPFQSSTCTRLEMCNAKINVVTALSWEHPLHLEILNDSFLLQLHFSQNYPYTGLVRNLEEQEFFIKNHIGVWNPSLLTLFSERPWKLWNARSKTSSMKTKLPNETLKSFPPAYILYYTFTLGKNC